MMSKAILAPHLGSPLEALKTEIRGLASLPLAKARSLPGRAYFDEGLHKEELGKIFRKEWICIGPAAKFPNPGDYLTIEIDEQPVFALRQSDGSIRAFANVCLHRFAQLVQGAGHLSGPVVCPYHAWSYNREGKLLATPFAEKPEDASCPGGVPHLTEYHVEIWQGFVFVTLNPDPLPLAERLRGLDDQLKFYEPGFLDHGDTHEEVWNVNWKLLTENFIESYHVFMVHKTTLEPNAPTKTCTMVDGDDAWALHFVDYYGPSDMPPPPGQVDIPKDKRASVYDFVVFPTFMATGNFSFTWWMSLIPDGPDRVKVRWGTATARFPDTVDAKWKAQMAELDQFIDTANLEDKSSLAGVTQSLRSMADRAGYLTPLEQPIWEFVRYLDRQLNAANDTALDPDRTHGAATSAGIAR